MDLLNLPKDLLFTIIQFVIEDDLRSLRPLFRLSKAWKCVTSDSAFWLLLASREKVNIPSNTDDYKRSFLIEKLRKDATKFLMDNIPYPFVHGVALPFELHHRVINYLKTKNPILSYFYPNRMTQIIFGHPFLLFMMLEDYASIRSIAQMANFDITKKVDYYDSALRVVIQRKMPEMVQFLVNELGAYSLEPNKDELKAVAASEGNVEILSFILSLDFQRDKHLNLDEALHRSIKFRNHETMRLLVDLGANVNSISYSKSALEVAASYGFKDGFQLLLKFGANLPMPCISGHRLLVEMMDTSAPEEDLIFMTQKLLHLGLSYNTTHPVILDALRKKKPLLAAYYAKLQPGLLNTPFYTEKITPMHFAAECGDRKLFHKLIGLGGDTHIRDANGRVPLHYALRSRKASEIIQYYCDNGLDINIILDDSGGTLLHWAVRYGNRKVFETLLKTGMDLSARNYLTGNTILMDAIIRGFDENMIVYIIGNGADIYAQNHEGWAALHFAVSKKNTAVAGLLIQHGAQLNVKTEKGLLPVDLAEDNSTISILLHHEYPSKSEAEIQFIIKKFGMFGNDDVRNAKKR